MSDCIRCRGPLDDVARYAGSPVCATCAWESGEMHDLNDPDERKEEAA